MEKQYVVGIDVGGQTTKIGVVDARGDVLAQTVIRSDIYGDDASAYIDALAVAVKAVIADAGKVGEVRGIGVGAPNGNYYSGTIAFAPNLVWAAKGTVDFSKMLSARLEGMPVSLTNDANAAAVGEMTYGVARTAREWLESSSEPSLLRDVENISSKDVYDAAKQGDALALRVFEYTGHILGRSFADFVAFSAPEAIVLFGGLARAKEFLYQPMMEAMDANLLKIWKGRIKIVFSQLKESDAAILGASALAWEL